MKHNLSITWLIDEQTQVRSEVITVAAEASLGRLPLLEFPDSVEGSLIDVPPEQIVAFKFNPGVLISFGGRRYKFGRLEKDGSFELQKDW
jgi:hypothetical protein